MSAATLKLECHRGRKGFDQVFDAWHELMGRVRQQCFYHHPYWFKAYLDTYPDDGDRVTFACIYRGPLLAGIFPTVFEEESHSGLRVADLPFGGRLYLADCVIADQENGPDLYRLFKKSLSSITGDSWDLFRARDVLRDSHLGHAVLDKKRFTQTVYTEKRCAEIPIGDYETAISGLKKKFRGNLNNARNKLNRAGDARFEVERSPGAVRNRFRDFVELEMSGWKGDTGNQRQAYPQPSAIGLEERKLDFYSSVIDQFGDDGCVEISNLFLDDKLIGAQVCLLLNETSYLVKVAYDEEAGKFSPGQLMIDYASKRYAEDGRIKRYNLITDHRWFEGWNPDYRDYVIFRDFNTTFRGTVACLRSKAGAKKRDYYASQH